MSEVMPHKANVGNSEHMFELPGGSRQWTGSVTHARLELWIGCRTRSVKRDVAFHLLHDLVDVAVENGHRAEAAQIGQRLFGIARAPAPRFQDGPHRHVSEDHD